MTDRVLEYLQSHLGDMLEDVRALVELESPSGNGDRLARCAHFLTQCARDAGTSAEILEFPGGNYHLRAEWGTHAGRPVLLLGHFDTVWPVGTLESMPFGSEGGTVCGPGVFDMKAGIVQGFWAIRALKEVLAEERHIIFLCTSDEETGSSTSRELIENEARGASSALVLEPSGGGALKTARKGVANFRVTAHGRAAHAGLDPEAGVNAIEELAHQILDLREVANRDAGSTVNVGVIEGGSRSNVIPHQASAEIDVRFWTASEGERITHAISSLRPHDSRVRLEVTGGINRPPMERTPESRILYERASSIAEELGFTLEEVAVGGGSDGNFCAAVGTPVLDGLGAIGGGAHALDEHVLLDSLPVRAALLCKLIASH